MLRTSHYGRVEDVLAAHAEALTAAYAAHPERFVRGPSTPRRPPAVVYINAPRPSTSTAVEQEIPHVLSAVDPTKEHLTTTIRLH